MVARVKREDLVEVVRGRDKGKRGTVQRVFAGDGLVLVDGLNIVKKHQRATGTVTQRGGIIEMEKPLALFKVMPVCPTCNKATKVGVRTLEDGLKARVCKRCDGMLS